MASKSDGTVSQQSSRQVGGSNAIPVYDSVTGRLNLAPHPPTRAPILRPRQDWMERRGLSKVFRSSDSTFSHKQTASSPPSSVQSYRSFMVDISKSSDPALRVWQRTFILTLDYISRTLRSRLSRGEDLAAFDNLVSKVHRYRDDLKQSLEKSQWLKASKGGDVTQEQLMTWKHEVVEGRKQLEKSEAIILELSEKLANKVTAYKNILQPYVMLKNYLDRTGIEAQGASNSAVYGTPKRNQAPQCNGLTLAQEFQNLELGSLQAGTTRRGDSTRGTPQLEITDDPIVDDGPIEQIFDTLETAIKQKMEEMTQLHTDLAKKDEETDRLKALLYSPVGATQAIQALIVDASPEEIRERFTTRIENRTIDDQVDDETLFTQCRALHDIVAEILGDLAAADATRNLGTRLGCAREHILRSENRSRPAAPLTMPDATDTMVKCGEKVEQIVATAADGDADVIAKLSMELMKLIEDLIQQAQDKEKKALDKLEFFNLELIELFLQIDIPSITEEERAAIGYARRRGILSRLQAKVRICMARLHPDVEEVPAVEGQDFNRLEKDLIGHTHIMQRLRWELKTHLESIEELLEKSDGSTSENLRLHKLLKVLKAAESSEALTRSEVEEHRDHLLQRVATVEVTEQTQALFRLADMEKKVVLEDLVALQSELGRLYAKCQVPGVTEKEFRALRNFHGKPLYTRFQRKIQMCMKRTVEKTETASTESRDPAVVHEEGRDIDLLESGQETYGNTTQRLLSDVRETDVAQNTLQNEIESLGQQLKAMAQNHAKDLEMLQSEKARLDEQLSQETNDTIQQVEKLTREHEKRLKQLKQELETGHDQRVANLIEEHEQRYTRLQQQARKDLAVKVQMQARDMSALFNDLAEESKAAKEALEKEIELLKTQNAGLMEQVANAVYHEDDSARLTQETGIHQELQEESAKQAQELRMKAEVDIWKNKVAELEHQLEPLLVQKQKNKDAKMADLQKIIDERMKTREAEHERREQVEKEFRRRQAKVQRMENEMMARRRAK